jgi:hypothetical protein
MMAHGPGEEARITGSIPVAPTANTLVPQAVDLEAAKSDGWRSQRTAWRLNWLARSKTRSRSGNRFQASPNGNDVCHLGPLAGILFSLMPVVVR